MKNSLKTVVVLVSAFQFFNFSAFPQGSLTPPGVPAATFKTLQQIEPRTDLQAPTLPPGVTTDANYHFIINQPGSYYLSANLGVTKPNGILINAAGVTLDLNGFEILRSSGTGGNGLEIAATSHRASIRHGSITGFACGVRNFFIAFSARACAFRDLAVSGCSESGILASDGAVLESCRAHANSGNYGIFAGLGSSLTNCAAYNNTVQYGIFAGGGSLLTNCTASNNTGTYGIYAVAGSSLTNCSTSFNTGSSATSGGIGTGNGCTITHSTAYYNASTATSTPSTGMGFEVGAGSTIQGCTASFDRGDGIQIVSDTVARDNTCASNGFNGDGAGIHSTGKRNRIEGNNVTDNLRGIDVESNGSLIIKNSASQNSNNYVIAEGNSYGVIVDDSGGGGEAVSGSSATATFGSPNAWANFSY